MNNFFISVQLIGYSKKLISTRTYLEFASELTFDEASDLANHLAGRNLDFPEFLLVSLIEDA